MVIGGWEKISMIDFPGSIATVIFTKACNFRCHFCYNPMLVLPIDGGESEYEENHPLISEDDFFLFLESRVGKIDGVVISGGEPTLQPDLKEFIIRVKNLGFKIKLDTNGTKPEIVKDLVENKLLDYIAMDVKGPLSKYEKIVGTKTDIKKIRESIDFLLEDRVDYELRTTLVPGLHELNDIFIMAEELIGAKKWFLQKFKSDTDLVNNDFKDKKPFLDLEIKEAVLRVNEKIPGCKFRE
jgi:pyruvate formate lyase activating enzyme